MNLLRQPLVRTQLRFRLHIKSQPQLLQTSAAIAPRTFQRTLTAVTSYLLLSTLSSPEATAAAIMPSRPFPYFQKASAIVLDLKALGTRIVQSEDRRQHGFEASRKIQIAIVQARSALERESNDGADNKDDEDNGMMSSLDSLLASMSLLTPANRIPREANLGYRVEEVVQYKAFCHFLETAHLLPPSACPYATDEEYLSGACMGLAQDLSRYGMGRATARDVDSVTAARNLVQDVLEELLQFDFRNGPLRRKYDGTKYALKTLETILYELAVTGTTDATTSSNAASNNNNDMDEQPPPEQKRIRSERESLLPKDELHWLRQRMEHREELRETLIKKSRDGQKAAKQAIFAMHRGDKSRSLHLLEQCESCITQHLWPIVQEDPHLRSGSFAGVLEEYVEAKLFYVWLYGTDTSNTISPTGTLLTPEAFASVLELEPEEYLGGLCDLTGEVGRYAVQCGTARDVDGVKLCLQTNGAILTAIQTLERTPSGMGKKMDVLRHSVEKLQRILYEMSLSEAAGGRNVEHQMDIDRDIGEGGGE